MDYRPLTNDASILANWRVFSEKGKWRPGLIVGTSNDDFGGLNSQSYYGTFAKALHTTKGGTTFSLYGGATHIVELEETRPVGGLACSTRAVVGTLHVFRHSRALFAVTRHRTSHDFFRIV